MKVENSNVISLMDRLKSRPLAAATTTKTIVHSKTEVSVEEKKDLQLTRALEEVVDQIFNLGKTAGEIHSFLEPEKVEKVLSEIEGQNYRSYEPSAENDAALLAKVDDLVDSMSLSAALSTRAFKKLDADRVADLLRTEV